MAFVKNDNRINKEGRPKGSANKLTAPLREMITDFLSENFSQMRKDFLELSPKDRSKVYVDLLHFGLPALSKVELSEDRNEQRQSFRLPDFVAPDGTRKEQIIYV